MTVRQNDSSSFSPSQPIYMPPIPRRAHELLPSSEPSSHEQVRTLSPAAELPSDIAARIPLNEWSGTAVSGGYQEDWSLRVSKVWGLDFHSVTMEQTLRLIDDIIRVRKPTYAVTANLNYAMLCHQSKRLSEFTQRAGLVLCDGMPILWRSRWNKVKLPERVAGADLIYRLAERSQQHGHRIYLYGAAEGVAEKTARVLEKLYPGCKIVGHRCPPFRPLSESEMRQEIDSIRQTAPDILLIALGQPKGEFWIEDHLQHLQVPLCIQLGASFDFVAGTAKRAPKIFQRTGLEWLYRTLTDPKRLAPRYLRNTLFLMKSVQSDLIAALDSKK
ncbi:MAG: WecB/TagA/CpsF family glycosyltransferase [Pirellula sp.]|jgi:N-acetylglucosaminyldiphosphoundecaprenol N-acetyl-beta-D-mannosaminyltransferase|nr:WecB/TagA/CpsF family glycosyltransferase [Pirellula sp.]